MLILSVENREGLVCHINGCATSLSVSLDGGFDLQAVLFCKRKKSGGEVGCPAVGDRYLDTSGVSDKGKGFSRFVLCQCLESHVDIVVSGKQALVALVGQVVCDDTCS